MALIQTATVKQDSGRTQESPPTVYFFSITPWLLFHQQIPFQLDTAAVSGVRFVCCDCESENTDVCVHIQW